jgi:hypothetical protein
MLGDPLKVIQHSIKVLRLNVLKDINATYHVMRLRRLINAGYARVIQCKANRMINLQRLA